MTNAIGDNKLLEVNNLRTSFFTFSGEVQAVRNVSFSLTHGEIVGIVGESGSGKSVTVLSVIRLLQEAGKIVDGKILFEGEDVLGMSKEQLRKLRNNQIGMVFQEPMTSLNPTIRVGTQITERIQAFNKRISKKEARAQAEKLLEMVKIPEAKSHLDSYPFEMSGGMRQRVMFAIAIACNPRLLVADEPTTSLDVTIQNQILKLIRGLRDETNASIILITHDLGVVAETCERVIVMYGGMIMEEGLVDEIFYETAHQYTLGLKKSIPDVNNTGGERLYSIYSGGDDLMFTGAWDAVVELARQIRLDLTRYAAGHPGIHASAGITLAGGKYPLAQAAQDAGRAEAQAKRLKWVKENGKPGHKDAVSFLGQALPWEKFGLEPDCTGGGLDSAHALMHLLTGLAGEQPSAAPLVQRLIDLSARYQEMLEARRKAGADQNRNKQDQVLWGPWMWQGYYSLAHFAEQTHSKDIEKLNEQLKQDRFRSIEWIGLAARWAELRLRKS